jgi:hypothetical protein
MRIHPLVQTFVCLSALLPALATAGHQVCNGQTVPGNLRRCPDGSMPMYIADMVRPVQPVQRNVTPPGGTSGRETRVPATPASVDALFGVWRTRIPGAVWTSPSGYAGYGWLHVSAGVSVGDLIIKPDGTYVWNSYGGKTGRWTRGNAEYPLVLIDTAENRRWGVALDPRHTGGRDIMVWDGKFYSYDGRR